MKLGGSLRRSRGARKDPSAIGRLMGSIGRYLRSQFGSSRFLMILGAIALGAFGIGYLVSTQVIFPAPPPPGDVERVPDLSGESLASAGETLSGLGLFMGEVDSLRHPSIPEGGIVGQSPLPGQLSQVGDTIRVGLSLGPETRPVPDVMRLRGDRAQIVLEATGFQVLVDSIQSETPRGAVLAMEPGPGTEATIPREILLTVSMGPPMLEMPLLLGLQEEQAVGILDSLGLFLTDVETRFRFGRDQGLVVEQEPPAATLVERGSAVRLVVGRRGR